MTQSWHGGSLSFLFIRALEAKAGWSLSSIIVILRLETSKIKRKSRFRTSASDMREMLSMCAYNTIEANKDRHDFSQMDEIWVFGYGSLLYKIDFPILDQRRAAIRGWERRFWQGSHDHRGTPQAPGRVLTLVPVAGVICDGMALRVDAQVFEHLDHREKNGYLRITLPIIFADNNVKDGIVYVADADNAAWAGPATEADIAAQIAISDGPSGANRDYLFHLADALRNLGIDDLHVFDLERLVKQRLRQD